VTRPPGRRGGGGRSPGRTGRGRKVKVKSHGEKGCVVLVVAFALLSMPALTAGVWLVAR
jgi:hypothetical protein